MIRPFALFVPLYAAAIGAKNAAYEKGWKKPQQLSWPVVSVGNISVGGYQYHLVAMLLSIPRQISIHRA